MDAYGSGDGKTKGAFRVWTNHIPSKSEKYAKTEAGKLNQVSNANVFILGRAACVELALAYGERGDYRYGSQTAGSILSACTDVLFVLQLTCF